jgi:HAD superfamily hydrolase (TIGR01509 family)
MFQALIFDFDGLMVDTESPEVEIWQELYARHGQEFPLDEWVRTVVGASIDHLNPLARLEHLGVQGLDLKKLQEEVQRKRQQLQTSLPPLPGVVAALDSARSLGLRLAIASSSPRPWVEGHLRRLGLFDRFELMLCREDVAQLKPHPDLYLAALSALHLRPHKAIALEDSPNGVKAAMDAGLRVVAVPNPITARLGAMPAEVTLKSLDGLDLGMLLLHFGDALVIREEKAADARGIRQVEEAAFPTPTEASLVDLIRSRGKTALSLVAVLDGRIVGHEMFTPVSLQPPQPAWRALGLGPIAILPEFQRGGIGSRLMRSGLEHCRRLGYGGVVLLGDPAFYSRFGFEPARSLGFSNDYTAGDEFQVLEIQPGALVGYSGRVKYIPEFKEAGA